MNAEDVMEWVKIAEDDFDSAEILKTRLCSAKPGWKLIESALLDFKVPQLS